MDTPPPITPPSANTFTLPQPPPEFSSVPMPAPGSIKVFGVIHLVLAAYGICTGAFGILSTLFFGKIMDMTQMGGNAATAEVEKFTTMMESLKPYNIMHASFSLILAVMLLIAGLSLLKLRNKGRTQSNVYAWTSIVFKLIYLAVSIIVIIPITKSMTLGEMPPEASQVSSSIDLVMSIMPIISIVLTFIYPIVALIMLNTRSVRDFLAGR